MASVSQSVAAGRPGAITGRNGWLDRYFYFAMSLVFAAIVVTGFSKTVDQNLFHAAIPRPLILWFHGGAFAGWILFLHFSIHAGAHAQCEVASLLWLVRRCARRRHGGVWSYHSGAPHSDCTMRLYPPYGPTGPHHALAYRR